MAHAPRPAHRRLRGLTLLEMLVTLVLVAVVATILTQALAQLARVERLLEAGQLRSLSASLRAEWTRSALEALLPGDQGAAGLRGGERELQGLSTAVPMLPSAGLALLRLHLVTSADNTITRLEMRPEERGVDAGGAGPAVVLLSWPGREGRFRYRDRQGAWLDRWPPQGVANAAALPTAVALETGPDGYGALLAVPRASPVPRRTRLQLEGM
jgi:prepilin-type N-terminal cleavage/methylation domain-containing protein